MNFIKSIKSLAIAIALAFFILVPVQLLFSQPAKAVWPGYRGYVVYRCQGSSFDICRSDMYGQGEINLTNNTTNWSANPRWSPDGSKIIYEYTDGIYTMNPDGSGKTKVPNTASADAHPSFTRDGTKVLFDRDSGGSNGDIFVIDLDGSNLTNLTNSPGSSQRYPVQSPATSGATLDKIAYRSDQDGNQEIFIMDVDGSNQTQVTTTAATETNTTPDWAPDASKIAYVNNPDETTFGAYAYDVWTINPDGTSPTKITTTYGVNSFGLSWAPDNTKIIYGYAESLSGGSPPSLLPTGLVTINPDGSGSANFAWSPVVLRYSPAWQSSTTVPPPPGPQTGPQGPIGATGPQGPAGQNGTNGTNSTSGTNSTGSTSGTGGTPSTPDTSATSFLKSPLILILAGLGILLATGFGGYWFVTETNRGKNTWR